MPTAADRRGKQLTRLLQPFFIMRHKAALLAVVLLLGLTVTQLAVAASLDEIRRIAGSGAVDLALRLFEEQAPSLNEQAAERVAWERARLEVFTGNQRWQALLEHVISLPPGMPDDFVLDADIFRAQAMLALERSHDARLLLRKLIWSVPPDSSRLKQLRELVMRSYLLDKSAQAAYITMQRFAQDYGDSDNNSRLVRARVLLLAGRNDAAADLLKAEQGAVAQALYLRAALYSARLPVDTVIERLRKSLADKKLAVTDRARLLAVVMEAARADKQAGLYLWACEELFASGAGLKIDAGLYDFSATDLWQAYAAHAQAIANERQLLVGDDAAWFAAAEKDAKNPLRQRAVYGWLALNAGDSAQRENADGLLLQSLQGREQGDRVIQLLYDQGRLADGRLAAPLVRYTLIEYALRDSRFALAADLLKDLAAAPAGIDPVMWHLRRARVFVLAGEVQRSEQVLHRILDTTETFSKPLLDRFMQVLFDLQSVKQYEAAYTLFDKLYVHSPDPQLQREILYWMADSRKAQQRYADAARLYLESARNPAQTGIDLWGQSAYYQAAEALTQAGYTDDARAIYSNLLDITTDPARRAVLQRQMQQLLLQQQGNADKHS